MLDLDPRNTSKLNIDKEAGFYPGVALQLNADPLPDNVARNRGSSPDHVHKMCSE